MSVTKSIILQDNAKNTLLPVTRGSLVEMYTGETGDVALQHINSYFPIKVGDVTTLTPEEKAITAGDTVDQTLVNISYIIENDELVMAAALNDLRGRINDCQLGCQDEMSTLDERITILENSVPEIPEVPDVDTIPMDHIIEQLCVPTRTSANTGGGELN